MHTVYSTPLCTPPCQCGGGCALACRRPRLCVMPFFMAATTATARGPLGAPPCHAGPFSQRAASLGRSFLPPLTHSAKRRRRRKALARAGVKARQPRAVVARTPFQFLRRPALGRRAARHKKWSRPWTGTSWRPSWRSSCGASRYNRLSVSPDPAIMRACLAGSTRRSCARMSSLRATCAGLPLSCSRKMTRRRGRANARASSLPKRRTRSWRPSKSTRLRHRRWRRCETRSRQQRGAANAPQHRHAPPPHPYQPWLPPNPSSLLVLTRCLSNLNLSF